MAVDPYCLQRQTMAKHDLLRHYLPVWARVLAQAGHDKLMYIDGFSFTGRYTSDEDGGPGGPGSPLIALECFGSQETLAAKGLFLFVEEKPQYLKELEQNVAEWPNKRRNDTVKCRAGRFDEQVLPALEELERRQAVAARKHRHGSPEWAREVIPAFVFIDPYGTAGFPMEIVRRVLALPRTEVFINLMWVRTAYNMKQAQNIESFNRIFGTDEWQAFSHLQGEPLARAYLDLYMRRLRAPEGGDAQYVRHFEMCSSDGALAYWMVFASKSRYGLEKMKEAMWKVDRLGGFKYRDTTVVGQIVLFEATPNLFPLRRLLTEHFQGRRDVTIREIEDFVLLETSYLPKSHLKKLTLVPMEDAGKILVRRPPGKRKGTFTDDVTVEFPAP